jgi:hypothetical protein
MRAAMLQSGDGIMAAIQPLTLDLGSNDYAGCKPNGLFKSIWIQTQDSSNGFQP